jgi:hypothetical protein
MPLPVAAVQRALQDDGLDGWLLYDFNGSNPIASRLSGLASSGKLTTRRWYYLVPATGEPKGLVHAIERHNLDHLPGQKRAYSGREELAGGLRDLLGGMKRVAMEYSPRNAIPYVSRVDGGTVEAVRDAGVEVFSSGDLVQRFEAVWSDEALTTHLRASDSLYRIKDRAFDFVRAKLSGTLTEFEVQSAMVKWFEEERLRASQRRRTLAIPTTTPVATSTGPFVPASSCCSISGVSCRPPVPCSRTSRGWDSPDHACPTSM